MSTHLLTGASGFLGRRILENLLNAGQSVAALGRSPSGTATLRSLPQARPEGGCPPALRVFQGDAGDPGFIEKVWREEGPFDTVLHTAAQLPAGSKGRSDEFTYAEFLHGNAVTTAVLLDAVQRTGKRIPFVYTSSISVFGRVDRLPIAEDHPTMPTDAYGLTKLQGEELVRMAAAAGAVRGMVLRYPGMIGLGNDYGAIYLYASRLLAGQPVSVYGGGRPLKDYIAVEDAAAAAVLAAQKAERFEFEVFHVGGCPPGTPPRPLVDLARWAAEAFGGGTVETNDHAPAPPVDMYFDTRKVHALLGFAPQPLKERIQAYVTQRTAAGA